MVLVAPDDWAEIRTRTFMWWGEFEQLEVDLDRGHHQPPGLAVVSPDALVLVPGSTPGEFRLVPLSPQNFIPGFSVASISTWLAPQIDDCSQQTPYSHHSHGMLHSGQDGNPGQRNNWPGLPASHQQSGSQYLLASQSNR